MRSRIGFLKNAAVLQHTAAHNVKNEYRLPFDMHFARALMAPRPLIATNALDDDWGNLYGDYITYLAAEEVYDFLDAKARQHSSTGKDLTIIPGKNGWHCWTCRLPVFGKNRRALNC